MHNFKETQQAYNQTSMSPPVQSAYLPDLEANYCKDYSCCGQLLPTLHDLLKHYEESHISPTPPAHQPKPIQNFDTVSTTDVFINNNNNSNNMQNQNMAGQMNNGRMMSNGQRPSQQQQQQQQQFGFNSAPYQQQQVNQIRNSLSHQLAQGQQTQQQQQFMLQQLQQGQIPDGQFAQHQLSQQHQQHPQQHTQPAPFPMSINNDDSTMDLDDEREEHFIDDPSRNLYVAQGSEKPFTCPVIGCNKTYKNQNGLKYHRLHGHQNQKLHQNPDGTYSVIDPNDGNAMEQDKPYRCEVCGKRYKNLNGLKYHRGHTTH